MVTAQVKGLNLADHFNHVVEMVKLGSGLSARWKTSIFHARHAS